MYHRPLPYVGITDFTHPEQVEQMLAIFKKSLAKHQLMVGVMMSYKTLHGLPTKWTKAFPPKESIADIFYSDDTYNCLHYADYKDYSIRLWENLSHVISYGGIGIHALQLDMIWPNPNAIWHSVHSSRKQLEVILQLNTNALAEVGDNPEALVNRLAEYEGIVHRVLLDKSMGRGLGMDVNFLRPFLYALSTKTPWLSLGVAGGLGPKTMHLLGTLPKDFPNLSIDAQGQLRPSGSALDPIDWDMARDYVVQALTIFR
ncbi:MAG: hypothetical protein UU70_C0012G0005 [Candidatus Yanofskybacteria bacterium GW2011_GWA1_41_6]|nr:MAG: hypothetical protein UU70_C0012G0005 [Candidatus Yanofskybacteria bacterium GW2011_GWA1_41_6]